MSVRRATASAHPNIAFIKYWGNADDALHLPANASLSMNLDGLTTTTTVGFDPELPHDVVVIDGRERSGPSRQRVVAHLDRVRALAGITTRARVVSESNFPTGAGIASSASAFAALSLAASRAAGLELSEPELSALARLGSGSACRSVPPGFVEWQAGHSHETSYAFSVAPPDHWALCDVVAIVSTGHKPVGSSEGHRLAHTSLLHAARVASVLERLTAAKAALLNRDLAAFGPPVEEDGLTMHAVMMTSRPPLYYWLPATVEVIRAVLRWRSEGLGVYFTIDAGPNVHCLCLAEDADEVEAGLRGLRGVQDVRVARAGGGGRLLDRHLF
jgi:diphosphomevalonate decarboxylase